MTATDDILQALNDEQRAAVCSDARHALVLAGAGSGKTRVIAHRIAWLHRAQGLPARAMLAVTFTNKAAREMRARAESLCPAHDLWLGTFHSLCYRLLRMHHETAGLPAGFQIIDTEDQRRMLKRVLLDLNLDPERWTPQQCQRFVNAHKEEGARAAHVQAEDDPLNGQLLEVYGAYELACRRASVVDFAELLLRALELLRDNEELNAHYRRRFGAILVDEFQDTNALQYAWLRVLSGGATPVFAVGDDDQSIYGWRGARVENIRNFERDFPAARVFRLERNYRSTGNILNAANALITHNSGRLGKKLWTADDAGAPLSLYAAPDEREEARFVAGQVEQWTDEGRALDEFAVLYRSNAQSRLFEEAFLARGIPYQIYGGLRFFERAVVKDLLAYLRLALDRRDAAAFERIVNVPARGIGARTVEQIRERARANGASLWDACAEADDFLPARAATAVGKFRALIEDLLGEDGRDSSLAERIDRAATTSGLREAHQKDETQLENIDELAKAAAEFERLEPSGDLPPLEAFLAHAVLESGGARDTEPAGVQMMTLHSAKGLEFPLVVMAGMEEELFPHIRSLDDHAKLEEERRLCYVGITRARERLLMTLAETRRLWGGLARRRLVSRFVTELPDGAVEELRPAAGISRPFTAPRRAISNEQPPAAPAPGRRVRHPRFGEGVVIDFEGSGAAARVQVRFERAGTKWLVLEYAKLETL